MKRVTLIFDSVPKKYEKDFEKAKAALIQAGEANVDKGSFTIDGVEIKIENLHGGK
jgi:hypothetical protein